MEKKERYFRRAAEFGSFIRQVIAAMHRSRRRDPHRTITIPPDFAERVMLAVTAVNQCKACSYLHSQTALEKGVAAETIKSILEGDFGSFDATEIPAVLYAQHFAETRGKVSDEARRAFIAAYGREKAAKLEGYIVMVCFGNLCSNTVAKRADAPAPKSSPGPTFWAALLCRPIAWGIRRRERADKREGQE